MGRKPINKDTKISTEPNVYEFDKHTFIVESEFKENSTKTLGDVLLRLINKEK